MAAVHGGKKLIGANVTVGRRSGGPRQQAPGLAPLRHAKDESFLLRPAGDRPQAAPLHDALVAPEISTAAAKPRMGLDVFWGDDRRPVSMALLKARRAGASLFFRVIRRRSARSPPLPTTLILPFFFFIHLITHKKDRQTDILSHSHTQHLRHGEHFGQRRRGHGNAHFF